MWGSGTSLSRFERENAGLRNELGPFWAWKCVSPERPLTRGAAERFAAVGGDERVEMKEILKMMISGTAKSAKKCKMVMLRNGFFGNLWKLYMLRNGNLGLKMGVSRAAHTLPICIHMEVPPPPPPRAEPLASFYTKEPLIHETRNGCSSPEIP